MSQLLPTNQARRAQESMSEYLRTTFALADKEVQAALDRFLTDPETGIFKGPFIRTRTPFEPQADGAAALDITPGRFSPYGHQARAFARLSSARLGEGERPQPTLVTTGTGSGKTEAFLYPMLDHVIRHRRHGGTGVSGLILYPMNALATDQAQRLARMITEDAQLGGIRAAIYTGDDGDATRSKVTADGLINDRDAIRANPPDILLTNYKMLDQMLLRVPDQKIWTESALSLRYLVLDEFHTYDGAQGTDVAMLLRRLGAKLKSHWPNEHPLATEENLARPLGLITPVATSATLGDKNDPNSILDFAETVFGETFTPDSVVTESRYTVGDWARLPGAAVSRTQNSLEGLDPRALDLRSVLGWIESGVENSPDELGLRALATLFDLDEDDSSASDQPPAAVEVWERVHTVLGTDTGQLLALVKGHRWLRDLLTSTTQSIPLADLAGDLLGERTRTAQNYLGHIIAGLSVIRGGEGRAAPTIDVHLWVRALTRIDRAAGGKIEFAWSDDGHLITTDGRDWDDNTARERFPAIYCRSCGRNGWGIVKSAVGDQLAAPDEDAHIRRESAAQNSRFRALISAEGEAELYASTGDADDMHEHLGAFDVRERAFIPPERIFGSATTPDEFAVNFEAGDILPVLVFDGPDAEEKSKGEYCPACGDRDSIRFLGAAVATLLSVSLSTLFGDQHLDDNEKKSLVFTDSVQDAAHRAGFVESRSHVLTLRNVIAEAVGDFSRLDAVAGQIISQAGDDSGRRYRVLPPQFSNDRFADVQSWWKNPQRTNANAVRKVMRRLAFDASLEFGLQARYGRTLGTTGTVYAEVSLPETDELDAITTDVLSESGQITGALDLDDTNSQCTARTSRANRIAWVRAVVERLRTQGGIHHEWLDKYVSSGGYRIWIWGKRPRDQGMPAFPYTRNAPAFAVTGMTRRQVSGRAGSLFDMVESNQGWYARFAARTFGITANHGAGLTKLLLARLAAAGVLRASPVTDSEATVYGIDPSHIDLERAFTDAEEASANLVCTLCRTEFPAAYRTRRDLDGTGCLMVGCAGTLRRGEVVRNFYRNLYTSAQMTRIVAREHSSMLETKKRKEFEDGFKHASDDPSAPNVLVATPTLEMGIDIGDLSTVVLGSLPDTVASYVQRVGRAGRLTGNALNLAIVGSTDGELRMIHEPLSVINGAVDPPATYLDAVEIIKRQYLAFLMDRIAQTPGTPVFQRIDEILSRPPGYSPFLDQIIDLNAASHEELLGEFLAAFGDLVDLAATELRAWATPAADGTCGLRTAIWRAHQDYHTFLESLHHRQSEIHAVIGGLEAAANNKATATEEEKDAYRQARSAQFATDKAISAETGRYWIEALETYQLLPNYTLLDDTAHLDVAVRWRDEDTQNFESDRIEFERGARQALQDFAPGSTFYGRSLAMEIDAVDLGPEQREVYELRFCAACGYTHDSRTRTQPPSQCPRCGDARIADVGQECQAVTLRKVSAMINRDEARINDADDERRIRAFTITSAADTDTSSMSTRWYVENFGFGVSYLDSVAVTTSNFGTRGQGREILAGGETITASGFTVCVHCGKLDGASNGNQRQDHRPWCPQRTELEEDNVSLVLTHELSTQGALIRLPENLLIGEHNALAGLEAAIRLGLAKHLGGNPDHINIITAKEPLEAGGVAEALLLHDIVPGGTGYLAELANHETMWRILYSAWQHLAECECRTQNLWACANCLLPYAGRGSGATVSRSIAEAKVREILLAGRPADTLAGDPETDVAQLWTVSNVVPQKVDPESFLERRFRQVLRARLESANIDVADKPAPSGTELEIHQSGTGLKWRLIPQLNLSGMTKPDFILRCQTQNIPDITIYTDGRAFHASNAVNRLADDAGKRAWVRGQGHLVMAISSQDVDEAEGIGDSMEGGAGRMPRWYSKSIVSNILNTPQFGWTAQADETMGNPIDVLIGLIQAVNSDQPRLPRALTIAADGSPVFFAMQKARTRNVFVTEGQSLAASVVGDRTGSAVLDAVGSAGVASRRVAFLWTSGPLSVLCAPQEDRSKFDVAVVLDDRAEAVAADGFADAWREWLQISNIFGLRSATAATEITTIQAVLETVGSSDVAEATSTSAGAGGVDTGHEAEDIPGEWAVLINGEDLNRSELEFARSLFAAGVDPVPEWGIETKEGVTLDFAWPEQRIAVLIEPLDGDADELRDDGWTLVSADADTVKTELATTAVGDDGAGNGKDIAE